MNEKLNKIINKFGMPALAVTGTAIAALLDANSTGITALPLIITTNLLSNKLTNLTELELSNRLKNIPPDKLNHDIFRVSKSAVKLALKATIDKYEIDSNTRKQLTKKIDEICKQLEETDIWNDITAKDIIDDENDLAQNGSKWSTLFADELKEANDIFKDANFDKTFQSYFHLYFGEYLKKDRPAYIAYERGIQKMILNTVNELKISLDSRNINLAIKDGIAQYIKEIPVIATNLEIKEEFAKELSELKSYFQPKKIIIREIKSDKLLIEISPNEIKEVGSNYDELKTIIADKYYFEYNDRLYSIDELNAEAFDYLVGKIKYNQLFTKRIIEVIKGDCYQQYPEFYNEIKDKGSIWDTTFLCREGQEKISENFAGIIGEQLYELFGIGTESQGAAKNVKYIEQCRYIVKRTLDLVIFAFLSQLWDDLYNKKMKLSGGSPLRKHFPITENQITLLRNLIRIYSEQELNNDALLLPDILAIADLFNENGELNIACAELEKFGDNPAILDCYFAEKYLTAFFEKFRFLVNYKIVSMKKIECFNIKNIGTNYLHHHDHLGREKKKNICCEMVNPLFSYAVLLYKNEDYTKNINLYPFAIDINALNFDNNISNIAFFRQPVRDKLRLKYAYLNKEKDKDFELEYKGIVQQKEKDHAVFLTDEEIKIYNKDCVYTTFKKIDELLSI